LPKRAFRAKRRRVDDGGALAVASVFFYADNPVARKNNVVAKLLAATDAVMDGEVKKPAAKELAAAFP
jgi:hypothetical protein